MELTERNMLTTPSNIVKKMIFLRRNKGRVLDPCAGSGTIHKELYKCVGIEIDPTCCPKGCYCIDFFDYPTYYIFDTIIGNPPNIAYKHITESTKKKLRQDFEKNTNLYVFFIDKCLNHLKDNGELIFLTPKDFLESANKLAKKMYAIGTITDFLEVSDKKFKSYAIWRFAKNNFSRKTQTNNGYVDFTGNS
jgi:adenine-specific DNA-methyltransferase